MARRKEKVIDTVDIDDVSIVGVEEEVLEVIPTGSHSLDIMLGVGGIARGKFTEIWGEYSSGKTTIGLATTRNARDRGIKTLYIDVENQLTSKRVMDIVGEINTELVQVIRPKKAEDALRFMEEAIESGEIGLIILDSIASLSPEKEMEDELTDEHYALIPRLLTKFFRRNASTVRTNNVAVLFLNQVRAKIGSYIPSFSIPGGHALEHFCSVIVALSKGQTIQRDKKEDPTGIEIKFKVVKNKLATPYKSFTFPLMFDGGIDEMTDLILIAERLGVIERRGAYYYINDENIGQGTVKVAEYLRNFPEALDKVKQSCYNIIKDQEE